jgi:acetylornithine/succinyldiaminopimelate/putrescine aminotransferase
MIEQENLLENATQLGQLFKSRFQALAAECDIVREVRVAGVMVGIELAVDGTSVVKECLARRVLVNCTHGTVIRLLPAMNLTEEQADEGCAVISDVIRKLPRQS